MTFSPIHSSLQPPPVPEEGGPAPSGTASSTASGRQRAADDSQAPPALRRRTARSATQGAPRAAAAAALACADSADSLASMSPFSDRAPGARARSPVGAASAGLPSLPSSMSWGGLAAALSPSVNGPPTSTSQSTADASSDDELLADDAASSLMAGEGHPENVRHDDVATIETVIGHLLQVAQGEKMDHLSRAHQFGRLVIAFDARGQLKPPEANDDARRMHDRLNRLAEGGIEHRDLILRFNAASHQASKRFWRETVTDMRAVRDACAKLQARPRPLKKDIVNQSARRHGERIRHLLTHGVLGTGVFKGRTHGNANADGLRSRIELLRTHAGERYAIALEKWRAFEEDQAPRADAAGAAKKTNNPSTGRASYKGDVRKLEEFIAQLKRLAATERGGSISRFTGDIKNSSLRLCINSEGGLKGPGHDFLERVRMSHPVLAQSIVDHSKDAVAASRERTAVLLRRLTSALNQIKESGGSLYMLAGSMDPVTQFDQDFHSALTHELNAAGTQISRYYSGWFSAKIARLEQSADAEQLQVIDDFRAALRRPHPVHGAPQRDPLEEPLQQARERLAMGLPRGMGRPPRPQRGRAAGSRADTAAPAAPPRSPAHPAASESFSLPTEWPATPPLFDLNLPWDEAPAQSPGLDLSDLPAANLIDFPSLPATPTSASPDAPAEAGSSQPHDAAWLGHALRHEHPEQRLRLANDVALLDAQLASMALGHVDELLRDAPGLLMTIQGGRFAPTVQRLLDLLAQP